MCLIIAKIKKIPKCCANVQSEQNDLHFFDSRNNVRLGWDAKIKKRRAFDVLADKLLNVDKDSNNIDLIIGREGFAWGGQYRAAGYFASIMLWASFASWLLMNLLLVAVPRYGAYTKVVTGILLISTNVGYSCLVPKPPLIIIMEGGRLTFHFGWCFWLILVAGLLCLIAGTIISVVDLVWPHTFSTIVEVYFDTPYDRHVILEESHDVRYQKRNSRVLDESLGHKILRRLSSKTRDLSGTGIDNRAYQRDTPNSPWHCQNRQRPIHPPLHRNISEDSTTSMQMEMQPIHKMVLSRKLHTQPIAEQHTVDMNW